MRGLKIAVLTLIAAFGITALGRANDIQYNASGNFGTTYYSGSLNGGTFSGTFTASLPISSTVGSIGLIATFNIDLIDSSGNTLANLNNTTSGDFANVQYFSTGCSGGPCDIFTFSNSSGSDFLELAVSAGFTGGSIIPFPQASTDFGSFAGIGGNTVSTDSIVTSGSIVAASEPASALLLAMGLLGLGLLALRRRSLATAGS